MPPPRIWSADEAHLKSIQAEHLRGAGVDIAIVGSSLSDLGLDPAAFEAGGASAFNASLLGATPEMLEPWVVRMVLPTLQPRTLIVSVTPGELGVLDDARNSRAHEFTSFEAGQMRRGLFDSLDAFAANHVALVRYRSVLRAPLSEREASPIRFDGSRALVDDDLLSVPFEEAAAMLRQSLSPGMFRVDSGRVAALLRLTAVARSQGVRVQWILMPITTEWVGMWRDIGADHAAGIEFICSLAERYKIATLRFGVMDRELFFDPVHLSPAGAALVSATAASQRSERPGCVDAA